jgi:hypothetical protein
MRTSVLCVGLGVGGTVEVSEKEKKIHGPCGKCLRTFFPSPFQWKGVCLPMEGSLPSIGRDDDDIHSDS